MRLPRAVRNSSGTGPLVLDGQIGDATPRIDLERGGEGVRSGQASRQARQEPQASLPPSGASGGRSKRGQDHAPRNSQEPNAARHQVGVLALPAQPPRDLGQRLLHQGRGVHEHLQLAAERLRHPAAQRLQPLLDEVVVVVALGVDRDGRPVGAGQRRAGVRVGAVVDPQHDGGTGVGPHGARMHPAGQGGRHPGHFAVPAVSHEGLQPAAGLPGHVQVGDPERLEAQFQRLGADGGLASLPRRRGGRGPHEAG